jgi:hypothetical protein
MVNIVFREPVLSKFLESPSGEVGKYLFKKGTQIVALAKGQVGVRSGALRSSIHMRHIRDSRGQYIKVGSSKKYARLHHEGSRPHMIYPRKAKMLRFVSRGQVVYANSVRHPGTKANKYLTDPMRKIVR